MKRYQHCSRPVQVYRWLRWKPLYCAIGVTQICAWILCGCRQYDGNLPLSRWETMRLIWNCTMGYSDAKMNHVYDFSEALEGMFK